jgi:RNA recognition motif-containing protein
MKNLFVGNMSFQTTGSDLRALFEPFGQITRVHVATDRETGRARGFAFVEMANDEEAAMAMAALDAKEVGGRNLKVNQARPKAERATGRWRPRPGRVLERGLPRSRAPTARTPLVAFKRCLCRSLHCPRPIPIFKET